VDRREPASHLSSFSEHAGRRQHLLPEPLLFLFSTTRAERSPSRRESEVMVSMSTTPHPLDSSVPGVGGGGGDAKEEARLRLRLRLQEDEEEGTRRVRKPYTITKSREIWTEPEHDKFLVALQL
jgi:hypothetical protein